MFIDSYFMTTDGVSLSWTLMSENHPRQPLDEGRRRREPINWGNFHLGCTLLDRGINDMILENEHVIGVDPGKCCYHLLNMIGMANVVTSVDVDVTQLCEEDPDRRANIIREHTVRISNGEMRQVSRRDF